MTAIDRKRRTFVLAGSAAFGCAAFAPLARAAEPFAPTFTVSNPQGDVPVYAYLPAAASAAPIWVVMHGLKRNAADYYAAWLPYAQKRGAILLAPQFSAAQWPKSWCYQLGNVMTQAGEPVPRERWGFTAVDHAVEEAARRAKLADAKFAIYGHGGGAQFVQRYVLHTGGARLALGIAANAGWYLVPTDGFPFPYGLRDSGIPEATLREAFAATHVVMTGLKDIRTDGVMRSNAQTALQGPTRVARAHFYFDEAKEAAERLGMPFKWRLVEVPEGGHAEGTMMPAATAMMMRARG